MTLDLSKGLESFVHECVSSAERLFAWVRPLLASQRLAVN